MGLLFKSSSGFADGRSARRQTLTFTALHQGFTLIEVLIVVAIIGIIAAIALPNYNDYVIRSRIPVAISALSSAQVQMEQYFQDNRSYAGAPCPAGGANFTLDCGTPTATAFTLTATGTGPMTGFVYKIDQSGSKTSPLTAAAPSGWSASSPDNCWVTNKGGVC